MEFGRDSREVTEVANFHREIMRPGLAKSQRQVGSGGYYNLIEWRGGWRAAINLEINSI
jgi:hypothetical protein